MKIIDESIDTESNNFKLLDNDLYLIPCMNFEGSKEKVSVDFTLNQLSIRLLAEGTACHIQLYNMSNTIIDRRPILNLIPSYFQETTRNYLQNIFILLFIFQVTTQQI